jgi:hypothetical protein
LNNAARPELIFGAAVSAGCPKNTKAPTPACAYDVDAAIFKKSPETMINWLSRLVIDQPATLMHVGGGVGAADGVGAGLAVGLVDGLALAVGCSDAVGVVDGDGVRDTVAVGVGVGPKPVAELLQPLTSSTATRGTRTATLAAIAMINRR